MTETALIQCSDDVLGGTPVFAGTRVPVQTLFDYIEEGENLDEFLEAFPSVSREHAVRVLETMKEMMLAQALESASHRKGEQ
ncbi:MAG: DUF433 domain-containing protein [Pyrinomonadaceae bacterium]|jgi:uncharacterized protein (DUF433 family)